MWLWAGWRRRQAASGTLVQARALGSQPAPFVLPSTPLALACAGPVSKKARKEWLKGRWMKAAGEEKSAWGTRLRGRRPPGAGLSGG